MKAGAYWYRGTIFMSGRPYLETDGWELVEVYDSLPRCAGVCFMGHEIDGTLEDVAAMEKAGEFIAIEPPRS